MTTCSLGNFDVPAGSTVPAQPTFNTFHCCDRITCCSSGTDNACCSYDPAVKTDMKVWWGVDGGGAPYEIKSVGGALVLEGGVKVSPPAALPPACRKIDLH